MYSEVYFVSKSYFVKEHASAANVKNNRSTAKIMQNTTANFLDSNLSEGNNQMIMNLVCLGVFLLLVSITLYLCNVVTLGFYKASLHKLEKGLSFCQYLHFESPRNGSHAQPTNALIDRVLHRAKSL